MGNEIFQGAVQGVVGALDMVQKQDALRGASSQIQQGAQTQRDTSAKYTAQNAGLYQPYYDTGTQNMTTLGNMMKSNSFNVAPYDPNKFQYKQTPGYQQSLQGGMGAIQGAAGAQGGMLSGATLKALARYGAGAAAQDYGNEWNRFNTGEMNRYQTQNEQASNSFNRYNTMSNTGFNAANRLSDVYNRDMETNLNADAAVANAKAGEIMGVSQAWSQNWDNISQSVGTMLGGSGGGNSGKSSGGGGGMGMSNFRSIFDNNGSSPMDSGSGAGTDFGGNMGDVGNS